MNLLKKSVSLLVTLALLLACFPAITLPTHAASTASGTCGDNLTWTLDEAGTLTISGTGPMTNFSFCGAPWYDSYSTTIKKVIVGAGVTSVGDEAFCMVTNLTDVTLGNDVTYIGDNSFDTCVNLVNISFPDVVTYIGDYAFDSCRKLTEVRLPASVSQIGEGAFQAGSLLQGIFVDEKNTCYSSDEYGVLFNKDKTRLIQAPGMLEGDYEIPDTVDTIRQYAFHVCDSLTKITVPPSVSSIGDGAFSWCEKLTEIILSDGISTITEGMLQGCANLATITIPDSVTTIGEYAFYYCTSLTDVYYEGTAEQWETISIGGDNEPLLNATLL